jgi:UDP-glucose 4-epimerase
VNILLTGGAGYIGSHTAITLSEDGHNVVLMDNFSNSCQSVLINIQRVLGKTLICINEDVRTTEKVEKILREYKIDAVMHFAGLKSVGESVKNPLNYYYNNVVGTLSLLDAMNKAGTKNLIFSSSATVYGEPQYLPIDENHPLSPINPYGRTKLHVEHILKDHVIANPKMKIVNLRYFNPVGAHDSALIGESPRGIPNNAMPFIAQVAAGKIPEFSVFGNDYSTFDGSGIRDYIHVMDLAEGHLAALSYLPHTLDFETFNLGTGKGYSVFELLKQYEVACGHVIPFRIAPRRQGDIASCYTTPGKANNILGWQAKRSLLEMCASSWNYVCKKRFLF